MDLQSWPDTCLNGGLIPALAAIPSRSALPIGRLNVNASSQPHHPTHVKVFLPTSERFVLQGAIRKNCGYGHYFLVYVEGNVAYEYDPDGGSWKSLLQHALPNCRYGGTLASRFGSRKTAPNRGQQDCSAWIAIVYHSLLHGYAKDFFKLPVREQRNLLEECHFDYMLKYRRAAVSLTKNMT